MKAGGDFKDILKTLKPEMVAYFKMYGFKLDKKELSSFGFKYLFRSGNLYVKFQGGIHPADYPGYINIIVGEGIDTFSESEKNSVALWRIKRLVGIPDATEYSFDSIYKEDFFKELEKDMEDYMIDFLVNKDSTILYEVLKEK